MPGTDGDCRAKCVWILKKSVLWLMVRSKIYLQNWLFIHSLWCFSFRDFCGVCAVGELNNPILGLYATQKWPHMPTIVKSDPWYRLPWIKARTWYGSFFHRLPPMLGFHQWPIYVPWPQSPPLFQSIYRVQGWNCIHSKVKVMCSQDPQPTSGSTFMSVGEPD